MKVKDLIKKLKECNQNAEVILYIGVAELDETIRGVEAISEVTEEDIKYCDGCSVVEEEFLGQNIVYIYG